MSQLHDDIVLDASGNGVYELELADRWMVPSGPNGGYLSAVLIRAAMGAAEGLIPRALYVNFLSALPVGPATIETSVLRAGRSVTTVDVALTAGGRQIVGRASLGPSRDGVEFSDAEPPAAPPPESVPTEAWPEDDASSCHHRYDMRFVAGGAHEFDHERAEALGWLRTVDHAPVDHVVLTAIADSWPPPIARRQRSGFGAPTMDLMIHYRDPLHEPIDDFVLVHSRTRVAHDGFVDLDTDVWSRNGRLLATARQLGLLIPRPTP